MKRASESVRRFSGAAWDWWLPRALADLEGWAAIVAALVTIIVLSSVNGVTPAHRINGVTAAHRPPSHTKSSVAPVALTTPYAVNPPAFSPGACMAFPPTGPDSHETVFLDAGHGGIDPGATGTTQAGQTIYEADQTLPIEMDTMTILRAQGFRVVVSRTAPTTVARQGPGDLTVGGFTAQGARNEVAARDLCANEANAGVLVGIYLDAGSSPDNAGCLTAFDPARPFASNNLLLANLVQRDELAAMNAQGWGIPDAGVKADTTLGSSVNKEDVSYGHLVLLGPEKAGYFSTPSQMPGTVVEPLFITDPFEGSLAASNDGQQVIAGALAQAIEQYFASPESGRVPAG